MNAYKGFTLLEVLIAAVIMFTVLSLSALGVQTFRLTSHKSERLIKVLTPVRAITMNVRQQLQQMDEQHSNGKGFMQEVEYQWTASLIQQKAAPTQLDPDTGEFTNSKPRFKLYEIQLTLNYQGFTTTKAYQEVVW